MIDYAIFSFSFLQGSLAFFAPCAVALLPGYISAFITRHTHEHPSKASMVRHALILASMTILGFLDIYGVAGILIALVAPLVKAYMSKVAMGLGGLIIILGILMALGKNVSFSWHLHTKKSKSELVEAFVFGIAYGLGALGCLFPLFLIVATSALSAPTVFVGASYFLAYFAGMSIFMIAFTLMAVFSKQFLTKNLGKIMPYITRVSGILLIIAGAYIIYYQSALL